MEGRRLERLVRAPDLEVRRAGHAVLPQWRSTPCPAVVSLPAGSAAASVVCGAEHTLVLTKEGGVLGFGRGESGQLGYGKLKEGNDAPVAAKVLEPPSRLALEAAAEDPADAAAAAKAAGAPARVTLLTACGNRSVCLSEEDSFFTWGAGWKARRKPAPKPAAKARKVGKLSKLCLTQVQLGDELGVAMDMVGRVYTFGGCAPALSAPAFLSRASPAQRLTSGPPQGGARGAWAAGDAARERIWRGARRRLRPKR